MLAGAKRFGLPLLLWVGGVAIVLGWTLGYLR